MLDDSQGLLMMPGERYDAIIDFEDYDGQQVYLVNNGPDEPFKTFDAIENRAEFNKLGQIMRFDVSLEQDPDDISTPTDLLCFDPNPGGIPTFPDPNEYRKVFLKEEITTLPDEALGPLAAVLDNVYGPRDEGKGWAKPITETIPRNQVEQWAVVNLSGK